MRGIKPTTAIEEAEHYAAKMGYHWVKNTVADLPFDAFMFRQGVIVAVRVKKVRYAIDNNVILEKKFPDEVKSLRLLPLPPQVLRELWIRTQNERAWRRFYILPETTAEIEFNSAENYRNAHFREKEWEEAPFRLDIPLSLLAKKKDEVI